MLRYVILKYHGKAAITRMVSYMRALTKKGHWLLAVKSRRPAPALEVK